MKNGKVVKQGVPVFLLLEGRITAEEAIDMVRLEFLGERGGM